MIAEQTAALCGAKRAACAPWRWGDTHMNKWGFLRETSSAAQKAGIDKDTGLHRTGLEEYLAVIFATVNDWVHDRALGAVAGTTITSRPDYRSEQLKLIVEFDGLQHYTKPDKVQRDIDLTTTYQSLGYKVARIPYFIQLSNKAVKTLFDVDVSVSKGVSPRILVLTRHARNALEHGACRGVFWRGQGLAWRGEQEFGARSGSAM